MKFQLVTLFFSSLVDLSYSIPRNTTGGLNPSQVRQRTSTVDHRGAATHSTNSLGSTSPIPGTGLIPSKGDHPDWFYRNGEYIPDQQDHFRFHCYLAMSVYGNYANDCPKTFPKGFKVLQNFSGGYIARVEEMRKIVIVFRGFGDYHSVDLTPASVSSFVPNCADCYVAAGVKNRYSQLRLETNDFQVARDAFALSAKTEKNPILFSVTGLGWGGALAALCGLHLGSFSLVHYSHNSGTPRFMNDAAVIRYDNIFQLLAGQSVVSRNDFAVQFVPKGVYSHIGQKVHIHGDKSQWYVNCFGNNENTTCLGTGTSQQDHYNYFTPIGTCGSADKGF